MAVPEIGRTATGLVESFTAAPPERLDPEYRGLVAALWEDGETTDLASPAVPALMAAMRRADDVRKGYLAVLLGLLAEAEYPATDGPITTAVREDLGHYLELWRRAAKGRPLSLALQYLLSHFPDDRDRILPVAEELRLDPDDMSRLERALRHLDPDAPDIGRAFPYPAAWELDDGERKYDQDWITSLTPEQVVRHWENDTRTVLGHTGAKAYWAVRHGTPTPVINDSYPPRDVRPPEADPALFARHAAAFRCPHCHGVPVFGRDGAGCPDCGRRYPIAGGILDVTAGAGDVDRAEDFLFKLAEIPSISFVYESRARPNFLRLCGSNWGGQVTPAVEDAYIAEHVRPVDGPVLDLAAGAGRWTSVLAGAVGAERVIALDLSLPMLATLRGRLPEVPAVLAGARTLPFGDATLGAVLCWNALQAFPDDAAAAIAEVGRCLRPGGTFTLLTFRDSDDPVYRHFVGAHHFPQHVTGLRLFDPADLRRWLEEAGLEVRHEETPGTFVILTAERRAGR